ncbi:peptide-methionine (R)-S-oxide reductase MsrB [Wenxinia saemankumensis]|uniref:peptide-methionine (R)-S-oxide reductase MsrB n=1 Tax=Wenxinia saemankumensis TaxID=1447782 RepID=UPI000933A934
MDRRKFLLGSAGVAAVVGGSYVVGQVAQAQDPGDFPFELSEAEWRERLTDSQFAVLREEATEPAYSSPLNDEKRAGMFHCAGCEQAVYPSDTKYDSGTGWPSFWAPVDEAAIGTKADYKLVLPRTEVHCSNCGGHLGHIFDDGPAPTGKRHCLNGVALTFVAA